MIVKVMSSAIIGIDSYEITVEVDTSAGLPLFSTVGLPDTAVRESKDRIKAAIKNSGYSFPRNHVTVNLAPADIKKEGTGFDLPVAVGILATEGILHPDAIRGYLMMGELSLDGGVKAVPGVISAAFRVKNSGLKGVIVSVDNAAEAAMVEGPDVIPVRALSEVVGFLRGQVKIQPLRVSPDEVFARGRHYPYDFSEIRGQEQAKRALEVAAAGGHHVLMAGVPGSGKTMLAQRLPSILPEMTFPEAIETTKIYSVAGLIDRNQALVSSRPFRAPHHTISDAGLVGGGQSPRPGEISLAHNGVLFLDELPEFRRNVLEVLRQPLEEGHVTISRSAMTARYPARFMLVAAMNPCPCGYLGDRRKACRCTPQQIRQYQGRISGPLLDRIDLHIEVPAVKYDALASRQAAESSAVIGERINQARKLQTARFGDSDILCNARMTDRQIRSFCVLDHDSQALMNMAMDRLGLSARAYTRVLKVARTIADLDGDAKIGASHVAEAIQYRSLDRVMIS